MTVQRKQLARHYLEMCAAMFLGMVVLGAPAVWGLGAAGIEWSRLTDDQPALMFLGMATTMTIPMVGRMMYRGHSLRANAEMSASMFAVIGLLWAGVMTDLGALMMLEHTAMLVAMAGVMLARPHEYAYGHHEVAA
jgi:glucose dehydrogenase